MRISLKFPLLIVAFLIRLQILFGQTYSFNRLNVKDGLSQSSVLDITKDKQGFMWIATRYGLNRYDGIRFKIYENDPRDSSSLRNNYINRLFRDAKDQIWVGTQEGLDAYDDDNDGFIHYPFFNNKRETTNVSVLALAETIHGDLWVGTHRGLLVKRQGKHFCEQPDAIPPVLRNQTIIEVFVDSKGYLWVATLGHIYLLKQEGKGLVLQKPRLDSSQLLGAIRSIAEDADHHIWFGSETDGLYCFDRTKNEITHFSAKSNNSLIHNSIRKLLVSRNQRLLIGTQNGVSVLDLKTHRFTNYQNAADNPYSLSQNSIYSLYEDQQGSLWVGTYFGGISLAYGIDTKFNTLTTNSAPVAIPHNVIRPIDQDQKKNLWFGTEGGGVFSLDSSLTVIRNYSNPTPGFLGSRSNFVKAIHADRSNHIWVGTSGGGLYLLNQYSGKFQQVPLNTENIHIRNSNILVVYQDTTNNYWICGEGYNKVLSKEGQRMVDCTPAVIDKALADQAVVQIAEASDKSIWILTTNTLFHYNLHTGILKTLIKGRKKPLHAFNCLLEDHAGALWLGVDYEGLIHIDPKKKRIIRRYTKKDGLCSENVVGIVEDKSRNLWITTTTGLSKLTADRRTIQNYFHLDGIADDEFNYNSTFIKEDGKVILGSLGGLTWFLPRNIEVNTNKPSIHFTGLLLSGQQPVGPKTHPDILSKNIAQAPHLTFQHDQNTFTIQFALDNYIKSAQNRFAYTLANKQAGWTTLDKAEISFSNLPPGHYVLLVRGANSDGIWSDEGKISFTIQPPFYWTWWAIMIYIMLIAVFVFFIVRYFYLKKIFEKEEELHQNKLNFFSMISHEIRSHLSLILVPIEQAREQVKDEHIAQQLSDATKNSERLLRLTSELMDFRKVETSNMMLHLQQGDIILFINEIFDAFKKVYESKDMAFVQESELHTFSILFDPLQLEKVLFNLLSNAVKHAAAHSTIRVQSRLENNTFLVSVSNYGEEIPQAYLEKIFDRYYQVSTKDRFTGYGLGLALSKRIMELHQGDIYVESNNGLTIFTLKLPCTANTNAHEASVPPTTVQEYTLKVMDEALFYETDVQKATLLLIEDDPDLMRMIETLLKEHYMLLKAYNGEEGLELARVHMPDLILSDVMMPLKNGLEVCKELKEDIHTSHIPILLLTAMSAENDRLNGLTHRADAYLTKPFNKRILLLHVRNLLRAHRILQERYRQEYVLGPTQKIVDSTDERFLAKVIAIIEKGIELSQYSVEFIGQGIGMSTSVLYKKVKSLTGMTVNDFSKSIRLKKAAQLLQETDYSVTEVAAYVGFVDSKYFSREFKKQFGTNPSQYTKEDAEP
ncbi:two-component regulator propeller domain-containing protein [Olivibacter ginsenosidimutans]|uniref:histidine kinase n=1 Tax=Olivibacter ginsenosidimutans TaxID=1176537 RepID=A0ABP9ATF5_9SPHI